MIDRQTQLLRGIRRWQPFLLLLGAAIWTAGTALIAGYWTYYTYTSDKRERSKATEIAQRNLEQTRADIEKTAAETRKLEAQRPFLQKKLDIYFEAVQVAGRLTQIDLSPSSLEWKDNARRFWMLRWSELEMVGDAGIREAARRVGEQIVEVEHDPDRKRHDLRWMVECLSDELRLSLEHSWGYQPYLERPTATGRTADKLPKGCSSGNIKPAMFDEMQDFKAESNIGPRSVILVRE
jgi:cell division protein FtsB